MASVRHNLNRGAPIHGSNLIVLKTRCSTLNRRAVCVTGNIFPSTLRSATWVHRNCTNIVGKWRRCPRNYKCMCLQFSPSCCICQFRMWYNLGYVPMPFVSECDFTWTKCCNRNGIPHFTLHPAVDRTPPFVFYSSTVQTSLPQMT